MISCKLKSGASAILLAAGLSLPGCGDDSGPAGPDTSSTSSWQIIRDDILAPNCVSCHSAGTTFASQSDLLLTADVAYEQLVNRSVNNRAADDNGLVRVSTEGLPGLFKSFLWEKINAPDQEHFYADHPYYGSQMPLGARPLTHGELEFIRRWIVAGAPETGEVVDPALLKDEERYQPPEFAPLSPPAQGIQLHLGPFEVAPSFERELFSYKPLENPEDIFVSRLEVAMRPGSHHLLLLAFRDGMPTELVPDPDELRDIRNLDGSYILQNIRLMLQHVPVAGTQWPRMNVSFPPGTAFRIPADSGLDLNSHYINRTSEPIEGEVFVNLHTMEAGAVEREAHIFAMSNFEIELPPGEVTTLRRDFLFTERRHVFQLVSHAHEHMTEFRVEVIGGPTDGELVYFALDWEHPPILELDPPIVLDEGQGFRLEATYDNWTDRELNFGLLSEDEMMILYGYYYAD